MAKKSSLSHLSLEEDVSHLDGQIFSVSDLNTLVKDRLENDELLGLPMVVQGELSNVKVASSGHVYFTLKDEKSSISAIMWSSTKKSLSFAMESGLEVLATGQLQVYMQNGSYSLICKKLMPAGWGALQLKLEALKQKLYEEGLFDEGRKQLLPPYPRRIGIITAKTGAVIHDMLRVFRRKYPGVSILLYPVAVQGKDAAPQMLKAIQEFNREDYALDLIVLARGGGSFEDLFCFNDEALVRGVADSDVPIITGIGHEPDFSLCDAAADAFASTPTAAAEKSVPDRDELLGLFEKLKGHLAAMLEKQTLMAEKHLDELIEALPNTLLSTLGEMQHDILMNQTALCHGIEQALQKTTHLIEQAASQLDNLSPLKTLSRGYAIVSDNETRQAVSSIQQLQKNMILRTQLSDGQFTSQINEVIPNA